MSIPSYPHRVGSGWIPKKEEDFGDGGAYPEIHVAQFPRRMGLGSAMVAANVRHPLARKYDSSDPRAHMQKLVAAEELQKPSKEEIADIAADTSAALEAILAQKASTSQLARAEASVKKKDEFVRYVPDEAAPGYNPAIKERIIRIVEKQVDPLEPSKFRAQKAPRSNPEPPETIQRAPAKKVTPEDQAAWKLPPCVSNWKNVQGYTIPLHMRLQADGRGLQEVSVNPKFAGFAEALYVAERMAREEVRLKNDLLKQKKQMEEHAREEKLREIAAKARQERTHFANATQMPTASRRSSTDSDVSVKKSPARSSPSPARSSPSPARSSPSPSPPRRQARSPSPSPVRRQARSPSPSLPRRKRSLSPSLPRGRQLSAPKRQASPSPRRRRTSMSPSPPRHRNSMSPSPQRRRDSLSPSTSPRRPSVSPLIKNRRRSVSSSPSPSPPPRRAPPPSRRSLSPSPFARRRPNMGRSRSPLRREPSPRRRSFSPRRRGSPPRRRPSYGRPDLSPGRRAPSPYRRRHESPARRHGSPARRQRSVERRPSPARKRGLSPPRQEQLSRGQIMDQMERQRRREIERELRIERAGYKNKRARTDEDRDISERIALGHAQPTAQEALYDVRLFSKDKPTGNPDITVADDDEEDMLYDKPLFKGASRATGLYVFDKDRIRQNLGARKLAVLGDAADEDIGPRSGPIKFERD